MTKEERIVQAAKAWRAAMGGLEMADAMIRGLAKAGSYRERSLAEASRNHAVWRLTVELFELVDAVDGKDVERASKP